MPIEAAIKELTNILDDLPEKVPFWLRDDDASSSCPQLESLLAVVFEFDIPIALAVIPAGLTATARKTIANEARATVLQHGYDHQSHAGPGEKKIELGGTLDIETLSEKLLAGKKILHSGFGPKFLSVLVPPWNRIHPHLVEHLGKLGFHGLSTFSHDQSGAAFGLKHINSSIDPIAWKIDRGFQSAEWIVQKIIVQLKTDPNRPIGLLTHHRDMDEIAFDTVKTVLEALRRHPKISWPTPTQLFGAQV